MKHDLPSFAVLIDADNVRIDTISLILEEITRHGRVTVRRIYGDFTTPNLAGWRTKLAEHALQPIQQYRNTTGKNASDSALIIDAMDLLHSRRFEGFGLVSSDSDFTRLATRIREDGLFVFGFGEKHAPKAFVNACERYIYVENLIAPLSEIFIPESPAKPAFKPPTLAVKILLKAYSNVADEQGWAMLGQLSSYIHANHSDFDPRTYGCAKFIELLQKTEAFNLDLRTHKNGQTYFCRPKSFGASGIPVAGFKPRKPLAYSEVLIKAVTQATAASGWAPVGMVGQQLKALGRTVKESGCATLTDALTASGVFEVKGKGTARHFRVKGKVTSAGL